MESGELNALLGLSSPKICEIRLTVMVLLSAK